MGYTTTVIGFGDNHSVDFDQHESVIRKFKLQGEWFPGSEFWRLLDSKGKMTNLEGKKILIDYSSLPEDVRCGDLIEFDFYDDIEVPEDLKRWTLDDFQYSFLFKIKSLPGAQIGTSGCFSGLIIFDCEDGVNLVVQSTSVFTDSEKFYQKLVSEGRMPDGMKLKIVANCCS